MERLSKARTAAVQGSCLILQAAAESRDVCTLTHTYGVPVDGMDSLIDSISVPVRRFMYVQPLYCIISQYYTCQNPSITRRLHGTKDQLPSLAIPAIPGQFRSLFRDSSALAEWWDERGYRLGDAQFQPAADSHNCSANPTAPRSATRPLPHTITRPLYQAWPGSTRHIRLCCCRDRDRPSLMPHPNTVHCVDGLQVGPPPGPNCRRVATGTVKARARHSQQGPLACCCHSWAHVWGSTDYLWEGTIRAKGPSPVRLSPPTLLTTWLL